MRKWEEKVELVMWMPASTSLIFICRRDEHASILMGFQKFWCGKCLIWNKTQ